MFSNDTEMSKQGTAGKMNRVTLMVPQKLEIIRGLKMMKLKRDYDFI
jgi:hypothetical protein